jgi:hypothetical protein
MEESGSEGLEELVVKEAQGNRPVSLSSVNLNGSYFHPSERRAGWTS